MNSGFKKALVGADQGPAEKCWPALKDSQPKKKRDRRQNTSSQNVKSPEGDASTPVPTVSISRSPCNPDTCKNQNGTPSLKENARANSHEAPASSKHIPSASLIPSLDNLNTFLTKNEPGSLQISQKPHSHDFPQLDKPSTTIFSKQPAQKSSEAPSTIPRIVFKSNSKNSKLKNSLINIPLLSFVKVRRHAKKKTARVVSSSRSALGGNKLDSDNPLRKKGKVKLFKRKQVSRLKREILLSRKLHSKISSFDQETRKIKCSIPGIINSSSELNVVENLGSLLFSLDIGENLHDSEQPVIDAEAAHYKRNAAKKILHSKNFKEYCTNIVNQRLLSSAEYLITTLRNFQDRLYAKDPTKAFSKRRYICGFKESRKFLLADRVRLIILATNLQLETDLPSGRVLDEIKSLCEEKSIPLVYVGRGNQIGYWTLKRRRVSIVSILSYEGAEESFGLLVKNWEDCKKLYETVLEKIESHLPEKSILDKGVEKNIEEEIRDKVLSNLIQDVDSPVILRNNQNIQDENVEQRV